MRLVYTLLLTAAVAATTAYLVRPEGSAPGAATTQESAFERVLRTGVLRCGYNVWAPSVLVDPTTGKLTGIVPDLVEKMAAAAKIKVEWTEQIGWSEFPAALNSGRIDAFCAGSWQTEDLASLVAFTQPVFYSPIYAYIRSDETRFGQDYAKLNQPFVRFATTDGAMSDLVPMQSFPKAQRVSRPALADPATELLDVAFNKADVVMTVPGYLAAYERQNPGKVKRLNNIPYRTFATPLVAVAMGEHNLVQMLNTLATELTLQGEVEKTVARYVGRNGIVLLPKMPYQIQP